MYAVYSRDGDIVVTSVRWTRIDAINAFLASMHEQYTWVYWSGTEGFEVTEIYVATAAEVEDAPGATVQ